MAGEYFREWPAKVKVIGMMEAVPSPTRQKPASDGQKYGRATAMHIPIKTSEALRIYVLGIPIISTIRSEANLEKAIQIMKNRYPHVKISTFTTSLK
jgi:hypothetical protein